jgi:hypothetical protein
MNSYHDPELEDVLQDDELRRVASMLSLVRAPEPPLDDAFRTGLRRQLMQQAWAMSEGRTSWWRRAFAPPGIAWAGAAAGLVLIASLVVWYAVQQPGGLTQVYLQSAIDGKSNVALQQPILVSFNQPMDHKSTQDAVQITPATNVTYSWDVNTLAVLPTSGNLAPNTQYQVTIGTGAKTASGQPLTSAQTITFVTQPPVSPSPSPSPRPTPTSSSLVTGEKQLVSLTGANTSQVQWSADSSTVYYLDGTGALDVAPVKGGGVSVIAADGVTSFAISPAGDRLAYVRGGNIEILTFADGKTQEISATPRPLLVGWAKDKIVWAASDGIYNQGANGPALLAPLPSTGVVTVVSIAPDGAHAAYKQDQNLFVLDLATGKSAQIGQTVATFSAWSPGGTEVLYSTGDKLVVSDMQGTTVSNLPLGEASWSRQDAILLGSDTDLYQVRPDGNVAATKLSSGTYHAPQWAPNGAAFVFFRGGAMWAAVAPAMPPEPTALDDATGPVKAFMQARLNGQADAANVLLDDKGKKAYGDGGLALVIKGDPRFTRFYLLTEESVATQPDTERFVVRLVLTRGKIDVSEYEETLTLVRDAKTRNFLVDQALGGPHRDLGKGAEVVSVDVAADAVKVSFDSDLDPGTVADGVVLLDSKGKQLDATATYLNRTVTISGLDLRPGDMYRLVVLPTVRDVLGHNIAAEYDLDLVGPLAKNHPANKQSAAATPSPSPAASPSPSPSPSPAA